MLFGVLLINGGAKFGSFKATTFFSVFIREDKIMFYSLGKRGAKQ